MAEIFLEFIEYRKWERAEYPRLKASETRHHPLTTRRIRKASVIWVIKPILYSNWDFSSQLVASPLCYELHYMRVPLYLGSQLSVPIKTGRISWTLVSDVNFLEFVHRWETSSVFSPHRFLLTFIILSRLDRFPVKVFGAFSYTSRQINAWNRSLVNGKLQHLLKNMRWKVARKRKIQ